VDLFFRTTGSISLDSWIFHSEIYNWLSGKRPFRLEVSDGGYYWALDQEASIRLGRDIQEFAEKRTIRVLLNLIFLSA
jgi:hypothetical protein